jgi:hypothetical protein
MESRAVLCCRFWMVCILTGLFLTGAVTHTIAGDVSSSGIVPVVLKGDQESITPVKVTAKQGTTGNHKIYHEARNCLCCAL